MIITEINKDFIILDEKNYKDFLKIKKIHLIKLNFKSPNKFIIEECIRLYRNTNRYIIDDNIRDYNNTLKHTGKKYYIENSKNVVDLISFFRKNNKILLNFENLTYIDKDYCLKNIRNIIKNVEIIALSMSDFDKVYDELVQWPGNVIVLNSEGK